jgi:hypothetical protein
MTVWAKIDFCSCRVPRQAVLAASRSYFASELAARRHYDSLLRDAAATLESRPVNTEARSSTKNQELGTELQQPRRGLIF